MSNQESNIKTTVPAFSRRDIARWRILLRALLKRHHQADRVLDREKPEFDGEAHRALLGLRGEATEASKDFEKKFRLAYRKWSSRNEIALSYITESCKDNPMAFTIIQENPEATAKELYDKMNERFSNARLVNLRQIELTSFNSMTVGDGETAEEFANRILQAKLRLKDFGEVIEDDVHCLMRLKEGLRLSTKYGQLATSLYASVDQTWKTAYQIVQVWDAQEIARPITSAKDPLGEMKTERANRAQVFRKRVDRESPRCNICHKKGHKWFQCRQRKKSSDQSTCYRCGKKGHNAAECYAKLDAKQLQERKRHREQRDSGGEREKKKSKWFDEADEGHEEFSAMMRVLSNRREDEPPIECSKALSAQQKLKEPQQDSSEKETGVLDSGTSAHMFKKRPSTAKSIC